MLTMSKFNVQYPYKAAARRQCRNAVVLWMCATALILGHGAAAAANIEQGITTETELRSDQEKAVPASAMRLAQATSQDVRIDLDAHLSRGSALPPEPQEQAPVPETGMGTVSQDGAIRDGSTKRQFVFPETTGAGSIDFPEIDIHVRQKITVPRIGDRDDSMVRPFQTVPAQRPRAPPTQQNRARNEAVAPRATTLSESADDIILADERTQVDTHDLKFLPYSATGLLTVVHQGGVVSSGTGFMVSPGLVITAAHVVDHPNYGAARQLAYTPTCISDPTKNAFTQTVGAQAYRVAPNWKILSTNVSLDYAVIALPDADWHLACGSLTLRRIRSSFYRRNISSKTDRFLIVGYPFDKVRGSLWSATGALVGLRQGYLEHWIDTQSGQSGAPIIAILRDASSGSREAVVTGIHTRSSVHRSGLPSNAARPIDDELIRRLRIMAADLGRSF